MLRTAFLLVLAVLVPGVSLAQDYGFSVGYGFGVSNSQVKFGEIAGHQDGRSYQFVQLYAFRDLPLYRSLYFTVEPSLAFVYRPKAAVEPALNFSFKLFLPEKEGNALYFSIGGGATYTTLGYVEQGTQFMFVLQAAVGFKWREFFLENRFRHYSNGGLATPNMSVNADIISLGFFF